MPLPVPLPPAEAHSSDELLELGDALLELDRAWRIVRVNRNQERLSGRARTETIGRVLWEVWPELASPESQYWREYHRCMEARVPVHFEEFFGPLGMWTDVTAYPVGDGGIAIFFRDVTAAKTLELEARQRVRDSEARARRIAENIRDLLVVLNAERDASGAIVAWRYAEANEGALELLGAPREEVVGRTLAEVLPARAAAVGGRLAHVLSTGVPEHYESSIGGRTLLVKLFRIGPDTAGSAAVEITDRKGAEEALRESEARFRGFFHSVMELAGVHEVLRDAAGAVVDSVVRDVNDPTLRFLGLSRQQVLGKRLAEVVPAEVVAALTAPWTAVLESGAPARYEVQVAGHTLMVSAARMGASTIGAVAEDVTPRKLAEEELRAANEKLKEADRRKDEFLGMLSHELRNPLAPIRNSLYILDHAEPTGQQARRAREVANRQIAHITRLVDDLLDVTRIARGKIELRRAALDLAAVARRTAEDYRALMQERAVELAVDVPAHPVVVHGDETRLAQVVGNLLHNAAKFTPAGGRVSLSVAVAGRSAALHVVDTGAGIDAETMRTVFEPFTQGRQTLARSEGGLGLGLALVRGLVALHGGEVSASSAGPGRGTEFAVTIPLAAHDGPRERGARGTSPAPERRRVLVVDDNRDSADSLAQVVSMLGHTAVVAYDASGALAAAAEELPDVVLCDLGLPHMDGYEVARRLRALAPDGRLRLVAVSGYAQPEDVSRARAAGFDAHVAKPPDPDRLAALIG